MKREHGPRSVRRPRRDRLVTQHAPDTYRARAKPSEPTVCPECAAVFREGRWCWAAGPADAARQTCPACQRTRDRYPAGTVTLSGDFLRAHRDEILGLVRNLEEREKAAHPLKRVMETSEEGESVVITTTDVHLANTIGHALRDAYEGELQTRFGDDAELVRVHWSR